MLKARSIRLRYSLRDYLFPTLSVAFLLRTALLMASTTTPRSASQIQTQAPRQASNHLPAVSPKRLLLPQIQ